MPLDTQWIIAISKSILRNELIILLPSIYRTLKMMPSITTGKTSSLKLILGTLVRWPLTLFQAGLQTLLRFSDNDSYKMLNPFSFSFDLTRLAPYFGLRWARRTRRCMAVFVLELLTVFIHNKNLLLSTNNRRK